MDLINQSIQVKDSEPIMYFLRAVLSYYQENVIQAIPDIESAIEKADENITDHYTLRGLCYAYLKFYNDAIKDFSTLVKIDPDNPDGYFYRGKCYFLVGDFESAYDDYKSMT